MSLARVVLLPSPKVHSSPAAVSHSLQPSAHPSHAMVQPTPYDKEKIRKQKNKLRVKLGKKIANMIDCKAADVIAALKVLVRLAVEALRKDSVFLIPKLVKLQAKPVPARSAGMKNICGKVVCIPARPSHKAVRASPAKGFKVGVASRLFEPQHCRRRRR